MSFLVYPLIDTLSVFILRILRGNSPFKADKNHIHHHFEKVRNWSWKTSLIIFFLQYYSSSLCNFITTVFRYK